MSLKLIYMGTPDFAVPILKSILNSNHNVLTVYTQNPKRSNRGQKVNISPIHKFSNDNNLIVRTPSKLNIEEKNHIESLQPDIVVVAAYGKIIPTEILKIKNIEFINVHASLLPRWRGAAPIQRSLIEMDRETGISIMKILPELDAGPFMLQEKVEIKNNDNYLTLRDKLAKVGAKLILESLDLIEKNQQSFEKQDENKVTYAKKIDKKESKILWNLPAKKIIAIINGLSPSPGAWFEHNNIRYKIFTADEVNESGEAGQILDDELTIACGNKAIKIKTIQKEGKKILKTKEFLAGNLLKKGEKLF